VHTNTVRNPSRSVNLACLRVLKNHHHDPFCRHRRSGRGHCSACLFAFFALSEPQLRARIRRGLLKVEQLHAIARDIYYARRGRVNARELHGQMNSCSCLTLLLACVIYWQAKEISHVLQMGIPEGEDIDFRLLEHVSPIEWENVILYGQYVLNPDRIR
jgi:Tn3 transposase DDE domain